MTIIERLQSEADQCRQDGANDIARLLDETVEELRDHERAYALLFAECGKLRQRAESAEADARRWQPIETAPMDGIEILAWREDCGQFIASYTSADSFPLTQDEIDKCDEDWLFSKDWFTQWPQAIRLEGSEVPTRWMPLPEDPAIDAQRKEQP